MNEEHALLAFFAEQLFGGVASTEAGRLVHSDRERAREQRKALSVALEHQLGIALQPLEHFDDRKAKAELDARAPLGFLRRLLHAPAHDVRCLRRQVTELPARLVEPGLVVDLERARIW